MGCIGTGCLGLIGLDSGSNNLLPLSGRLKFGIDSCALRRLSKGFGRLSFVVLWLGWSKSLYELS